MKKRDHFWRQVSCEFIRSIRGGRSQRAFSRRLGYRGKPVADWEAGRRFPTAAVILHACQLSSIDVIPALGRFYPNAEWPGRELGPDQLAQWLRSLRGSTAIVELAARADQPRFSISRWLSGQSRPRLPQFFALVEAMTGRVSDLIAELTDIDKVPAIRDQHRRHQVGRRLAHDQPWTSAVQRVLETEAYRSLSAHRPGWIAAYLGIDLATEERCVELLEHAGMIARAGGIYSCKPTTVDTQVTPDQNRDIKRHWAHAAAARIDAARDADLFAYNVVSVSRQDLDHIRQILRSAFREIRSLVSASEPQEAVALLQLQLVTWDPPPLAQPGD